MFGLKNNESQKIKYIEEDQLRLMGSKTSQPVERAVVIAVATLMRQPIPVERAVVMTVAALMWQPILVERAMVIFAATLMNS